MYIDSATMETSAEVLQKIQVYPREKTPLIKKIYMHPHVHYSIIWNSQDMNTSPLVNKNKIKYGAYI